jgi:tetratricopeptide (TPR) repeat protein/tRNA A-37 threonylcarbamoyl transferase component Bud32
MTDPDFQRMMSLFDRACRLDPDRRAEFLERECGSDAPLRRRVEELLAHDDGDSDSFVGAGVKILAGQVDGMDRAFDLPEGTQIDRYRLIRRIGAGGMGTVYEAEQDQPKRRVALKIISPLLVSAKTRRRFELEAQVLARLQHPGIAQVFDAGTAGPDQGRVPFFAMELIDGVPLTEFVESRDLSVRQRLDLLVEICHAVEHAHQQGVIHRDLKPGNILVTPSGRPKVLDFGIARLTEAAGDRSTILTDAGQVVGTLPYMSPEHVGGMASEVDTRSDVYALGVLAFELLTGRRPFETRGRSLAEVAKQIETTEPPRLGTTSRLYRGDLETIIGKALEKDKARRYQSVADLRGDIQRYLCHEPILARAPSTFYQLRKFAARNRAVVAGGTLALIALAAGAAAATWQAYEATVERSRAQREARIASAVNEFLNRDLLAQADPDNEPDRNISLRAVVDRAAAKAGERFADDPTVEAAVRTTLAETYKGLGEYAEALTHARRAWEIYGAGSGNERDVVDAMTKVASLEKASGNEVEAETHFRNAMSKAVAAYGEDDELALTAMNNLALLLDDQGKFAEAAELLEKVLARRSVTLGDENPKTMDTMNNLAMVYEGMERFDEAQRLHVRELETCKRVMGPEHPDTLISMHNLGVLYGNRGDLRKAEPLFREVIEIRKRVLGPDHPLTLLTMDSLVTVLYGMNRFEEAEPMILDIVDRSERALGTEHPQTVLSRSRLAYVYFSMNRLDDAERAARESFELRRRISGAEHPDTALIGSVLCRILLKQGDYAGAEGMGRTSYDVLAGTFGPEHSRTRDTARLLEQVLERLGRPEEAAQWRARAGG